MKKHYSIDIKIQAVLKAARPGVLAQEVADEIGIHTFSLYRWKKELRDAAHSGDSDHRFWFYSITRSSQRDGLMVSL